jgi:hypothetical protein
MLIVNEMSMHTVMHNGIRTDLIGISLRLTQRALLGQLLVIQCFT